MLLHRVQERQRESHERRGKKPGVEVRQGRPPSEINGRREFSRGAPFAPAQGQRRHQAPAVQHGQAPGVRTASSLPVTRQADQVPVISLDTAPKLRTWAAVLSPEAAKPEVSSESMAARFRQSVQPLKNKNLVDPAVESINQVAAPSAQGDAGQVESLQPSSTVAAASPWTSSTASGNKAGEEVATVVPTASTTTIILEQLVEGSPALPTEISLPAIVFPAKRELVSQSPTAEKEAIDHKLPQPIAFAVPDSKSTGAKLEEGATGEAGRSSTDSRAIGGKEGHTVRPSQDTQTAVERRRSNGDHGDNIEPGQGPAGYPGPKKVGCSVLVK